MGEKRAYHNPIGNPCKICGLALSRHWVSHNPSGNKDCKCGVPWENHKKHREPYIVGIDGEGVSRDPHRYVLLAYANRSGTVRKSIEAKKGSALSTVECLDFLLEAPKLARFFSFAFNYDLTKILEDCDDKTLYMLFRPDLRPGHRGPKPVHWNGYVLNLVGSKFVVQRGRRRTVIWDTFKFYQQAFIKALKVWKVGDPNVLEMIERMKKERSVFTELTPEIKEYCFQECEHMAQLTERLIDAHNQAGLTLRSYYGAGSTGGAILKKMGIDKAVRTGPDVLTHPVACAFAGGRFENSIIGPVEESLLSYDISSAYPYQTYFLPCLACGKWEYTQKRKGLELSTHALVHYGLGKPSKPLHWGPFPYRTNNGSIVFAQQSGGGWVWRDEFLAAEKTFPNVQFRGAWVYKTDCNHRPFEEIAHYYRERLRIGKEGAGIVFKLGPNSVYGKLAQSIGVDPPFQSWIWAGMVTSGTRAQILDMLALHKNPRNLLSIATDGIYTREKIVAPKPRDTGTHTTHNKPLGGWELDDEKGKRGMFFARPGIYFPLHPTETDADAMRARGIGRKTLYTHWKKVILAFKAGRKSVTVGNVDRFYGAKTSISRYTDDDGKPAFRRSIDEDTGKPYYGQWKKREIEMTFDPMPKRDGIRSDNTLRIRSMPMDVESAPYKKSVLSPESIMLKQALIEILEQPDGDDFADYEGD